MSQSSPPFKERHRVTSPGHTSGPRRKQAKPRRRSGDSNGTDMAKQDTQEGKSFHQDVMMPENLSMKDQRSTVSGLSWVGFLTIHTGIISCFITNRREFQRSII
jgi:hypothetical protein